MNGILETAVEVCAFMQSRDWKFCVIGGLAVQQWGEPRTTLDVDFTLLTDWGREPDFVDPLLERFEARISDAREFALTRRVLLIRGANGTPADVSLGAMPYEVKMVERAVDVEFAPNVTLPCCSAEDLFIMKAFASRPTDWADAESVANRQAVLDVGYIMEHLRNLSELKEAPEILFRAEKLLEGHQ